MINSMKQTEVNSTALFNQAFVEAEAVYKDEVRLAGGKTKETRLAKLMWSMRFEFNRVMPRLIANIAYAHGDNMVKLREQLNVVSKLHDFNAAAQMKMQTRMSWSAYMELPLLKMYQADTECTVDDINKLCSVLSDREDYDRFIIRNSSLYARDLMQPLTEVAMGCKNTWGDLQEVVRKAALNRMSRGTGSKTDKIICRQAELNTYMIPYVASRYLKVVLGSWDYTTRQIAYSQEQCDKAVRENVGLEGDARTRTVDGYTDLSHSEKEGYCDGSQADAIRQRYLEGDDEKGIIGIAEMQGRLDDLELIEQTLLDIIQTAITACKNAKLDAPGWAYTWDANGNPVQDRKVALAMKAEYIAMKRAQREKTYMQQRDDEGRYFARCIKVPTFELEFGYSA